METKPRPAQEKKWAEQYTEIVRQANLLLPIPPATLDNSSLAQPPAYDEVLTAFSTSAGDLPIVVD